LKLGRFAATVFVERGERSHSIDSPTDALAPSRLSAMRGARHSPAAPRALTSNTEPAPALSRRDARLCPLVRKTSERGLDGGDRARSFLAADRAEQIRDQAQGYGSLSNRRIRPRLALSEQAPRMTKVEAAIGRARMAAEAHCCAGTKATASCSGVVDLPLAHKTLVLSELGLRVAAEEATHIPKAARH
jgi:hypothetical protein